MDVQVIGRIAALNVPHALQIIAVIVQLFLFRQMLPALHIILIVLQNVLPGAVTPVIINQETLVCLRIRIIIHVLRVIQHLALRHKKPHQLLLKLVLAGQLREVVINALIKLVRIMDIIPVDAQVIVLYTGQAPKEITAFVINVLFIIPVNLEI